MVALPDESLVGREVEQVVEPLHLLLDDLGDGVLHRLGRGARIDHLDGDGGGAMRELRDRQRRMASRPASMITMAITQAKIGRSMKKLIMAAAHSVAVWVAASDCGVLFASCGGRYSCGITVLPGLANCSPSTITRSPALSPEVTSH